MPRENKSSMQEAIVMLLILRMLPRGSFLTTADIDSRLRDMGYALPRRTLQRYLKALTDSGQFGIEADTARKPARYTRPVPTSDVTGTQLAAHDCLFLRLAEEHLRFQMPPRVETMMRPLFTQAAVTLNETTRSGAARDWLRKVAVVPNSLPFEPPAVKPRIYEKVSAALYDDRQIVVEYEKANGEVKTACVNPLGLVQQDVRNYLVVTYDGTDDIRHLALHRIRSVKPTAFPIVRPAGFSLPRYVEQTQAFNYDRGWIRLEFTFTNPVTRRMLEETPMKGRGQVIERLAEGEGWRFRIELQDSRLLDGWLAMWGEEAGIRDVRRMPVSPVPAARKPEGPGGTPRGGA